MSRIKTAWMLFTAGHDLEGETLEAFARFDRGWLCLQTEILETPSSLEPPVLWDTLVKQKYCDRIHAVNPNQKIGLYDFGVVFIRPWDPAYIWGVDSQLLHKPNGDPLIYVAGVAPATFNYRWVNYARAGVRADHAARYAEFCTTYGLDGGIFKDSYDPRLYADWIAKAEVDGGFFGLAGGIREGPYHLSATWEPIFATWTTELRDALEAVGAEVWVNGVGDFGADTDFLGTFHVNVLNYAHGALDEGIITTYGDATIFARTVAGMRLASATGGSTFYLAMPYLWSIPGNEPGFTVPNDVTLSRYFLATYLLSSDDHSHFGYQEYAQGSYLGYRNGEAYIYWSDDWDHDYGHPTGRRYDGDTTQAWWREFTAGYAVVNPTADSKTFDIPGTYRTWHPTTGPVVRIRHDDTSTRAVLPAYTGHFFFHDQRGRGMFSLGAG